MTAPRVDRTPADFEPPRRMRALVSAMRLLAEERERQLERSVAHRRAAHAYQSPDLDASASEAQQRAEALREDLEALAAYRNEAELDAWGQGFVSLAGRVA